MRGNRLIPGFIHSLLAADVPRCRSPPLRSEFPAKQIQIGERTMFDNTYPYALRMEIREGAIHYLVSFADGQSVLRETEVSREVYLTLDECRRHEKRQKNFFDRHIEHSNLTDETLNCRALHAQETAAETVARKEEADALHAAIAGLPEVQRRRFILHHGIGLTYEQSAEVEGCSKGSVFRSVSRAEAKIREVIKNF
jgi:RNA polymerase sigma-70 factor (ECF subfamily)